MILLIPFTGSRWQLAHAYWQPEEKSRFERAAWLQKRVCISSFTASARIIAYNGSCFLPSLFDPDEFQHFSVSALTSTRRLTPLHFSASTARNYQYITAVSPVGPG
jgi:hypothetical protein